MQRIVVISMALPERREGANSIAAIRRDLNKYRNEKNYLAWGKKKRVRLIE